MVARAAAETTDGWRTSIANAKRSYSGNARCVELLQRVGLHHLALHTALYNWDYPVQLSDPKKALIALLNDKENRSTSSECLTNIYGGECVGLCMRTDIKDDQIIFPLKAHVAARTKVNLFFRHVYEDAKRLKVVDSSILCCFAGMFNDEATGWLMYYCALKSVGHFGLTSVFAKRRDYAWLKELSTIVKALGTTGDKELGMLCEVLTLRGRGCDEGDLDGDITKRVDPDTFSTVSATVPIEAVKRGIDEVLREELRSIRWEDPNKHWTRRWAFTKSGAHSKRSEELLLGKKVTPPGQVNKRVFAECMEENVIALGEPRSIATVSRKLEHGKTRFIYSTDTVSYYTYDYICQHVERSWCGKRVLLKPGIESQNDFYSKLFMEFQGHKLMLDYDDFNSQHATELMKYIYERVSLGAPEHIRAWCIAAADNEFIRHPVTGEYLRTVGTLFSGHRCTTLVNSILNAAYMRAICGDDYSRMRWRHAGDDLIASTNLPDVFERILVKIKSGGIRANPSKQSTGFYSGEFLRMGFGSNGACGYLARCIAGLVSGNWVSENELGSMEYVSSILRSVWSGSNRSGWRDFGLLVESELTYRIPRLKAHAYGILKGTVSYSRLPCRYTGANHVSVVQPEYKVIRSKPNSLPGYATKDFINEHLDHSVLRTTGISAGRLHDLMLTASSYGSTRSVAELVSLRTSYVSMYGATSTAVVNGGVKTSGVLSRIFPLAYFERVLDRQVVRAILEALGYEVVGDPMQQAWGRPPVVIACDGAITYQDVQTASRVVTVPCILRSSYPVYA